MSDYYTPPSAALPSLEFDTIIPNREAGGRHRVHFEARHCRYHEFVALEDLLIGEIALVADPSGKRHLTERRIKMRAVVERISNLNPAVYPGGEISGKEACGVWIDAPENADAVWAGWSDYAALIDNPTVKSTDASRRDGSGEDAGGVEENRPAALLSAV